MTLYGDHMYCPALLLSREELLRRAPLGRKGSQPAFRTVFTSGVSSASPQELEHTDINYENLENEAILEFRDKVIFFFLL